MQGPNSDELRINDLQVDALQVDDLQSVTVGPIFLRLVVLAFVILILNKAYFWSGHPLLTYPDQSAYLAMAEMICQGKLPYIDFFEWNPPLIMYLNLIPVVVAKIFHIPTALALNLSVLTLSATSSLFSLRIAYKYLRKQQFLLLLPMLFAVSYFSQELLINSGEREHLFVLAYLPFFVLRSIVWRISSNGSTLAISKSDAICCGILAGIGMALKPQFVASAVVVELFFWYQFRSTRTFVRPEICAVLAFFAAYALACCTLPGSVWDVYFHQVVPLYMSGLSYSSESLVLMLRTNADFYVPFAHMILTLSMAIGLSRYSYLIAPIAALSLSFFFHYFYGAQSWPYRFLPMTAALYMLDGLMFGIILNGLLGRLRMQRFLKPILCGTMISLALLLTFRVVQVEKDCHREAALYDMSALGYKGNCLKTDLDPLFFFIVDKTKRDDSVFFMGTGIGPGYPAILQACRQQGSRYIFCLLPFLDYCVSETHAQRWQDMTNLVIANYGRDISVNKPTMIIIQKRVVLDLLVQNNFQARFMSEYGLSGETEFHEIWVRANR